MPELGHRDMNVVFSTDEDARCEENRETSKISNQTLHISPKMHSNSLITTLKNPLRSLEILNLITRILIVLLSSKEIVQYLHG